jgi:hypothetical protein
MPQKLDTIETSTHPIFGVIPLNEQIVFQGLFNKSLNPQVVWGKREKGDNTLFQSLAEGHVDTQMFELLKYGFPLDIGEEFDPADSVMNHLSAVKFPEQVQKYIDDEMNYGALKKADATVFKFLHKLPLMSRLICHGPKILGHL